MAWLTGLLVAAMAAATGDGRTAGGADGDSIQVVVRAALAKDPAHRPAAIDLGVALARACGMEVTRPEYIYPAALEGVTLPDGLPTVARTFGTLAD